MMGGGLMGENFQSAVLFFERISPTGFQRLMKTIYGIVFVVAIIWILGLIFVLTGCAGSGEGAYYEPALLPGTIGYQEVHHQDYNPYAYPQFYQPYQTHFEPLRIDPAKGY